MTRHAALPTLKWGDHTAGFEQMTDEAGVKSRAVVEVMAPCVARSGMVEVHVNASHATGRSRPIGTGGSIHLTEDQAIELALMLLPPRLAAVVKNSPP